MTNAIKTAWIKNRTWLVCVVCLIGLALNESPPGCFSVPGENGEPALWLCRFAGAALGQGLLLLALGLPFATMSLLQSDLRAWPTQLAKAIILMMAWTAYVRWDLMALGPTGAMELFIRGWVFYTAAFAVSVLAATICAIRPRTQNLSADFPV